MDKFVSFLSDSVIKDLVCNQNVVGLGRTKNGGFSIRLSNDIFLLFEFHIGSSEFVEFSLIGVEEIKNFVDIEV